MLKKTLLTKIVVAVLALLLVIGSFLVVSNFHNKISKPAADEVDDNTEETLKGYTLKLQNHSGCSVYVNGEVLELTTNDEMVFQNVTGLCVISFDPDLRFPINLWNEFGNDTCIFYESSVSGDSGVFINGVELSDMDFLEIGDYGDWYVYRVPESALK